MRPLNRPMFRYGGPIKEGIMSGIREPHANGGRTIAGGNQMGTPMGNRTGFADPSSPGFWKRFLANYTPKNLTPKNLLSRIMPWKKAQAAKYVKPAATNIMARTGLGGAHKGVTGSGAGQQFLKNLKSFSFPGATKALGWAKKAKNLAFKYPKSALVGGVYVGPKIVANVPTPKWSGSWGIKDILVPDEIYNYETGRWFNPDDTDLKPGDKKILDEKITETNPWKEKYEALVEENKVPKKSAEEIRAEKLQKYRDIVDIKGMNSEAAAKSLIEASRLINESQDFKGDIRSGKLINRIIQGTSKAYDKPADMKRAIDTLILKSEIQHDLNKEEKKIANELNLARIEKLKEELEGNTFAEAKALMRKSGSRKQAEITNAAKSLKGVNYQGTLISKKDFKEVIETAKNTAKDQGGTLSEEEIIEGFATKFIADKKAPDGEYVVGDAIISIKGGKVVPGSVRR